MKKSAVISMCKTYRYQLRRTWDEAKPVVLFIGLNPSTADAESDDRTSRVCIGYAKRWDFGGLLLGNLFACISTDKSVLPHVPNPVGPKNDDYLLAMQKEACLVVCAWGDSSALRGRDTQVLSFIKNPHCLVRLKSGRPGHPLYKRAELRPIPLTDVGSA